MITQPKPIKTTYEPTWKSVIRDFAHTPYPDLIEAMQARDTMGREKYGVPLTPGNGRDSFVDATEEALDLLVYLKNAAIETTDAMVKVEITRTYRKACDLVEDMTSLGILRKARGL